MDYNSNLEISWEDIREYFLPKFKQVISDYKSVNYSLLKPTKKYLKTPEEIIIFYSLQSSQEIYKFFNFLDIPNDLERLSILIIELYKKIYINELKMVFTIFNKTKHEQPTINKIRKIIFLARYEGEGPTNKSEKTLENYIAFHFFNSIKPILTDKSNIQIVMGNVYNHIWQTGQFVKENFINSENPNYKFDIN